MGLDIVEIAFDNLTDHRDFEKLASEIMREEGYLNIKPLGGVRDEGRDAVQESYSISEGHTIVVFQYTLQRYLPGKIEDTIDRLSKAKKKYHELVIVTPRSISTGQQQDMIREARKKHQVTLRIFERKTLVNRLSNLENDIFSRHFPDIEKQVSVLLSPRPLLADEESDLLQSSMLKASIALTFGKDAPRVRKSIFDYLTLDILLENPSESLSIEELAKTYAKIIGGEQPPHAQITASWERLTAKGLAEMVGERVKPTKRALEATSSRTIQVNEATESLISDIIHEVCRVSGEKLSEEEEQRLRRNTQDVLVKLFRLFGMELANQVLRDATSAPLYSDSLQDLVSVAKRQVSPRVGELLISVISETLRAPTEEQAQTLANWSLAYLGAAIMNLDPYLREFQATHFKQKIFILDTDFVLDCLVQECSRSKTSLRLAQTLVNLGSRVIIPESCFEECIIHARVAHRTYEYFGHKLLSLTDTLVDEKVWNLFVRGYYYGRLQGTISPNMTFDAYLHNYYDPERPVAFLKEVLQVTFPEGIEICNPTNLLKEPIADDQMAVLREELLDMMQKGPKAAYRTPLEKEQLADTDARLFLTAIHLNKELGSVSGEILGGVCYLITASARYLWSARKIDLKDVVTTRPQSLVALLELVGDIEITATDFVHLFENPLLIHAVSQVWKDVERLLDAGVILQGKSIARLNWDLEERLHAQIVAFEEADMRADSSEDEHVLQAADSEYVNLLDTTSSLGYRHIEPLHSLTERTKKAEHDLEAKAKALDELTEKYERLEEAITHFGKRKQRYLRTIARGKQR